MTCKDLTIQDQPDQRCYEVITCSRLRLFKRWPVLVMDVVVRRTHDVAILHVGGVHVVDERHRVVEYHSVSRRQEVEVDELRGRPNHPLRCVKLNA